MDNQTFANLKALELTLRYLVKHLAAQDQSLKNQLKSDLMTSASQYEGNDLNTKINHALGVLIDSLELN